MKNQEQEQELEQIGVMTWLRSRGTMLLIIICFAMAAFIIGDVLVTGRNIFGSDANIVGTINGEKIASQDFQEKVNQAIENYKASTKNASIDDATQGYLASQTWEQVVNEKLLNKAIEDAKLTISSEELFDLVQGKNPDKDIVRQFSDPKTGMFNPANVINFLKNLETQPEETQTQWAQFQKFIIDNRLREKYSTLIRKGMYVTNADAKADYQARNTQIMAKIALADFNTIVDSTIKVSESELEEYYNKNKFKFKQRENQRSFEYIFTDVVPSKEDSAIVKEELNKLSAEFKTTNNDTTFIDLNNEEKFTGAFLKKSQLTPVIDSNLYNAAVGTVYGPYIEGGFIKVSKLLAVKQLPDSVKARHILLDIPQGTDPKVVKAKADSLKKMIQGGANFADLARTNSKDQGSAALGGDLGYFTQGKMVKPFNDACFEGKKGEIQVVESQFGYHIIEVQDQKNFNKSVQLGNIQRTITASNATVQTAFAKANALRSSIKSAEDFDKVIPEKGVFKQTAENVGSSNPYVAGINNPKELIRWAFGADKNDISEVFDLGAKFVFAKLTAIKDKGYVKPEFLKNELEAGVRREKKGVMLTEKLNGANVDNVSAKTTAQVADSLNINFTNGIIPGMARELKVVGVISTLTAGANSKPLVGERGVYLAKIEKITPPMATTDYTMVKAQLENSAQTRAEQQLLSALKNKADIEDNRLKLGF